MGCWKIYQGDKDKVDNIDEKGPNHGDTPDTAKEKGAEKGDVDISLQDIQPLKDLRSVNKDKEVVQPKNRLASIHNELTEPSDGDRVPKVVTSNGHRVDYRVVIEC